MYDNFFRTFNRVVVPTCGKTTLTGSLEICGGVHVDFTVIWRVFLVLTREGQESPAACQVWGCAAQEGLTPHPS